MKLKSPRQHACRFRALLCHYLCVCTSLFKIRKGWTQPQRGPYSEPHGVCPPVLRGAFFQLEVALPLPALTALSECLPVLLTRAVAEAAFCSLGDWLNVCRMPRGVVAEPRDSWLEACSGERVQQLVWGRGQQRARCSAQLLLALADLFPPTRDP